jgi:large subunit ribosomal protein L28
MARRCDLTGKGPSAGNNVSHSNRKTKRRFIPNIQKKRVFDEQSGEFVKIKLSTRALRTLSKAPRKRNPKVKTVASA